MDSLRGRAAPEGLGATPTVARAPAQAQSLPLWYSMATQTKRCFYASPFFCQALRDITEPPEGATPRPVIRARRNMSLQLEYVS